MTSLCARAGRSSPERGFSRCGVGVHRLFEAQAARTPEAPALICREEQWSYRVLDRRADELAGELRRRGVAPGMLVGICAERSCALGAAVLAVLKAGAAYVPLEPDLPEERLRSILADCRPAAVLADRVSLARAGRWPAPMLPIDASADGKGAAAPPAADDEQDGEDLLAYVIYTSGTTGAPKGVRIGARALAHHCRAVAQIYRLRAADRVLQFSSFGFDVAAEEMFPAWAAGAAVVMWPAACPLAPIRAFVDFIAAAGVTVINLPAPYWHEWVGEIDRVGVPRSLRLAIVGSDVVLAAKAAAWQAHTRGHVRLVNAYGATETTITATTYEVPRMPDARGTVPIGSPLAGVTAYVLDGARRPVPVGGAGELYLGGACLAQGYLHRPEEEAARFCPDPFTVSPCARLYRTGDLARRRADGALEFLGRCDDQIKVRGCRVELAEIEALLRRHERVRSAAVIARLDASAGPRLVAYIVGRDGAPPGARELRRYVGAHLPEYMIPQAFVPLRRLPLTAAGKLDRGRLLSAAQRAAPAGAIVAPRGAVEAELVRIWETILDTRPIGVRNDFFELGGDSLLLVRLAAQIERRLGLDTAVTALLQARTVEAQARLLVGRRQARRGALICPCRVRGTRLPLFCHGGSDDLARLLDAEQPVYWLDPHGMNGGRVPGTVEEMAAEYLEELSAIQPRGPYALLGYSFGGLVMLELARLLLGRGEEVGLLVLVDPSAPPELIEESGGRARAEQGAAARRWSDWHRAALAAICRGALALGGRVPAGLRLFHFACGSDGALARYRARPYPGSFVLFRRPDNLTAERWRALAAGPVEIHESWVDHNDFLEAPHVERICTRIESHFAAPAQVAVPVGMQHGGGQRRIEMEKTWPAARMTIREKESAA